MMKKTRALTISPARPKISTTRLETNRRLRKKIPFSFSIILNSTIDPRTED